MAVSDELKKVPRPVNTICKMIGDKCAVIQRIGCKRIDGRNVPVNGPVIGHIINGKYVAKESSKLEMSMKDYGDFSLAYKCSSTVLDDLKAVYGLENANKIYAISLLRALNRNLKDHQIQDAYDESFASETIKDLALSKSSVSTFIESLGKDYAKALLYMQNRINTNDKNSKIAIDGMLKTNNSRINSLSDFSYKGRIKSSKDISIIMAFDIASKEILCSLPYAGNTVDFTSFPDFLDKMHIENGTIIGDKGMSDGKNVNVGFLFPLKRNLKLLEQIDIYSMNSIMEYKEKTIMCKKASHENKFYYGYQDLQRASKEKIDFMKRNRSKLNEIDFRKKEKRFGTVVYVSNQDLTLKEAYQMYEERWEIELVYKFYKNELLLSSVREHNDYSIYGSEFINLISSIIGCKMKNEFEKHQLFDNYTFGELLKILKRYKKIKDPKLSNEWIGTSQTKKGKEVIGLLGI